MVSIFPSTESYLAHDEKTQGYDTIPPNRLLLEQNTCWITKALFSPESSSMRDKISPAISNQNSFKN